MEECLVLIKQEVLDFEEEKMDTEAVEVEETVEITALVGTAVLILCLFSFNFLIF